MCITSSDVIRILTVAFYQCEPVWPSFSDLSHQRGISTPGNSTRRMFCGVCVFCVCVLWFFLFFFCCINSRDCFVSPHFPPVFMHGFYALLCCHMIVPNKVASECLLNNVSLRRKMLYYVKPRVSLHFQMNSQNNLKKYLIPK